MSISVSGVGRVVPSQPAEAQPPSADATLVRAGNSLPPVEIDDATNLPKPPRFPWLSRLTAELEPAATQKAPFRSASQLGELLDQAA